MESAIRLPAVAGRFYPSSEQKLRAEVEGYLQPDVDGDRDTNSVPKIQALGRVVPHAGYMYSGHVAGAVYRRIDLPQRMIILCPNHPVWESPWPS
jgi:MEMO1 family protein